MPTDSNPMDWFDLPPASGRSSFPPTLTESELDHFLTLALAHSDPKRTTQAVVHFRDPRLLCRCLDAGLVLVDTPATEPSLLSLFTTTLTLRHTDGPMALLALLPTANGRSVRPDTRVSPLQEFLAAAAQMDHPFFAGPWPALLAAYQRNFAATHAHQEEPWQDFLADVRMSTQIIDLGFHAQRPSTPFLRPHLTNLIDWATAGLQRQHLSAGLPLDLVHSPLRDRFL